MRRRRFIAAAVSATGAGLVPAILADAAVAAPDRLNGSTTLATAINDLSADLWRTGADYVAPSSAPARADLLDVAQWQWAQSVVAANRARRDAALHRTALTVEADAARQLAMIYADRRQYVQATKLYRQATLAAGAADAHELIATIRTGRAYMPLYAGNYHRTIDYASTALEALHTGADRPGGRAFVCAHALLARCYAGLGDAEAAEEALRHAYGGMSRYRDAGSASIPAPHHPSRFAWVKLRLATAEVYAALGHERQHTKAHQLALDDPSVSQMHRPMLDMGKAELEQDPTAAADQALAVLRRYDGTAPNPIVGRARALAARASARDPRSSSVQDLRIKVLTSA